MTTAAPTPKHVRIAQVVSLVQDGRNGQQIADQLGISYDRVRMLARLGGVALPGTVLDRRARAERLRRLALDGFTSHEIAAQLGLSSQHVRKLARDERIEIIADVVNGRTRRRLDSARVISKTIEQLDGIGTLFDQLDYSSLPQSEIEHWLQSLDEALTDLLQLRRQLQEAQL